MVKEIRKSSWNGTLTSMSCCLWEDIRAPKKMTQTLNPDRAEWKDRRIVERRERRDCGGDSNPFGT